jgi:hypothetical protein
MSILNLKIRILDYSINQHRTLLIDGHFQKKDKITHIKLGYEICSKKSWDWRGAPPRLRFLKTLPQARNQ